MGPAGPGSAALGGVVVAETVFGIGGIGQNLVEPIDPRGRLT